MVGVVGLVVAVTGSEQGDDDDDDNDGRMPLFWRGD